MYEVRLLSLSCLTLQTRYLLGESADVDMFRSSRREFNEFLNDKNNLNAFLPNASDRLELLATSPNSCLAQANYIVPGDITV